MKQAAVFFRLDATAEIGLGHLVRCIALAKMLENDFEITFVCKEIPKQNIAELKENGFNLTLIDNEDDFLSFLNKDIIVVLDHYCLNTHYQKNIKNIGCKLVCVDDLHDKVFFADLIINHAPGITPTDYQAQTYTQFALGLDYVLLRPEFLNKAFSKQEKRNIETAFVCFGGSDQKNITGVVANILKADVRFKKIIVVIGTSYNYVELLKSMICLDDRFKIYHGVNAQEMCDLMLQAQLAIVPASGILQEVMSLNIKTISGMYVENQKFIFENYLQIDAFENAEDFQPDKISNAINNCFKNQIFSTSHRFIDGRSGDRLLNIFKGL